MTQLRGRREYHIEPASSLPLPEQLGARSSQRMADAVAPFPLVPCVPSTFVRPHCLPALRQRSEPAVVNLEFEVVAFDDRSKGGELFLRPVGE